MDAAGKSIYNIVFYSILYHYNNKMYSNWTLGLIQFIYNAILVTVTIT